MIIEIEQELKKYFTEYEQKHVGEWEGTLIKNVFFYCRHIVHANMRENMYVFV